MTKKHIFRLLFQSPNWTSSVVFAQGFKKCVKIPMALFPAATFFLLPLKAETSQMTDEQREVFIGQLVEDQDLLLTMVSRLQSSIASDQLKDLSSALEAINDPALEAMFLLADGEIVQDLVLAENETIERILEAGEKAASGQCNGGEGEGQGGGESSGGGGGGAGGAGSGPQENSTAQALLNMMRSMAGRPRANSPASEQQSQNGEGEGEGQGGNQPGKGKPPGSEGNVDDSGETSSNSNGIENASHQRRIPSSSGQSSVQMPEEYRDQLDSYFKAIEETR